MYRKLAAILVAFVIAGLALVGCAQDEETAQTEDSAQTARTAGYEDGVYFAQGEFSESSGWKDVVVLEVTDGRIVTATWDAAHRQNGIPKYSRSQQGEYGMLEGSDATEPWFAQADAVTAWLLENQDVDGLALDDEGRPDAISAATINVAGFKSLVQEALEQGPVGYGMWEDGDYSTTQSDFGENGWKDVVSVTVIGGRVVAAEWDSLNEDGLFKADLSQEGEYGMVENGDAMAPWHEQADAAEQWLIANQDPSVLDLNDDGRADAVSGATITLEDFKSLAAQALEGHER